MNDKTFFFKITSLYYAFFKIETFLFQQDDPIEKNYSIMAKVNTIYFFNKPLKMQYMLNHVLS
jgi:hypothetical protein